MSSGPIKSLTGFRDFFPEDCLQREFLFQHWRDQAGLSGFQQYDGPPLESLELFTRKSGEEISGQLYHFRDQGDRDVALRPEMTPTLARMIAANHRNYKKPMKWFSIAQVFRYERPQKGRLREHVQWNADIIGEGTVGAEIECLSMLIESLRSLGLKAEDIVVRISDRQFWHQFLADHAVPEAEHYAFLQVLDKMERVPAEVTKEKLGRLYEPVQQALEAAQGSEAIVQILDALGAAGYGDYLKVDLSIVRGLAYYSGVVFEIHDRAGEFRAIAGGGRYDGLLQSLCGVDMPAVGFGMGDVVLTEFLKTKGLLKEAPSKEGYYFIIADEEVRSAALAQIAAFRRAGYRVDYPLSVTKVGKQFQQAEELGYDQALIFDHQWVTDRVCDLKDLRERKQSSVRIDWDKEKLVLKKYEEEK
ncbi:MAG: histidine--tRNA ligase [Verrucomicrobiota bacterium]